MHAMITFLKSLLRQETEAEMLMRQLQDAKRERTMASCWREHYESVEEMLRLRVARIEGELREMQK